MNRLSGKLRLSLSPNLRRSRFLGAVALLALALPLTGCLESQRLRQRVEEQDVQIRKLREDGHNLEDAYYQANEGRAQEAATYKKNIDSLNRELSQAREIKSRRERELEDQVRNLSLRVEVARTESQAHQDKSRNEYDLISRALREESTRVMEKDEELATLRNSQNALQQNIEALNQQLAAERSATDQMRDQTNAGISHLETARQSQGQLEAELARVRTELETKDREIAEAQAQIEGLQERAQADPNQSLASAEVEIARLQAEVNLLREGGAKPAAGSSSEPDGFASHLALFKEAMAEIEVRVSQYSEAGGDEVMYMASDDGLRIILPSDLLFRRSTVLLKVSVEPILMDIGDVLSKTFPDSTIRIEGHTDDQPVFDLPFADNWGLGVARADSVRRFLNERAGLPPDRVAIVSRSFYDPLAGGSSRAARIRNRRVEIVVPAAGR